MKTSDFKFFSTLFIVVALILSVSVYNYYTSGVSKDSTKKEIIIKSGETYYSIIPMLKKNNLIKSEAFFKLYVKINKHNDLKSGTYFLSEDMSFKKILEVFEKGPISEGFINITFKEGINIRKIANIIEEKTNNTADEVFELLKNKKYIDGLIEKYWFLTSEISNKDIYYPLEGYLFPDTYQFLNKDVTIEKIFEKMLDNTDEKLSIYKDDILKGKTTVHEILTLASIIELEANTYYDRTGVSSVFYNRMNNNIYLGSDVTTYYAFKIDDWSKGLTSKELSTCNSYNTRANCFLGLPVGPISNPSIESIKAALYPDITEYYYFVADCSGKTHFAKTITEHEIIVASLKKQNKWCDN
ncbi:MAG TPA: endolytic transglycosylase MltG [Tenericutes bacterium]|nr:endolytic transglycosylase MltG [Mycoplasmatota bacterium]